MIRLAYAPEWGEGIRCDVAGGRLGQVPVRPEDLDTHAAQVGGVAGTATLGSMRLFYVTLSTPDLDRAIAWYKEKLGFQLYARKELPDYGTRLAILEQDSFRLELIQQDGSVPALPARGGPPHHTNIHGYSQMAFLVDDLDATIAEMKRKGVEPVWIKLEGDDIRISFQFVQDCDGNLIQFVELMQDATDHLAELINAAAAKR